MIRKRRRLVPIGSNVALLATKRNANLKFDLELLP
jgi:hypothetical protein